MGENAAIWIALITGLPAILIAIATLIAVIKGNTSTRELINGKLTQMIEIVKDSSEVKGQVGTLTEIAKAAASPPAKVQVIGDRRNDSPASEVKK